MDYAYNLYLTTDKSYAKTFGAFLVSGFLNIENIVENVSGNWSRGVALDNNLIYLFKLKSGFLQFSRDKGKAIFSAVDKKTINDMADDLEVKDYTDFIKSCAPLNLRPCQ